MLPIPTFVYNIYDARAITHALVINWDQMESKLIIVFEWTRSRKVAVVSKEDKITVLLQWQPLGARETLGIETSEIIEQHKVQQN